MRRKNLRYGSLLSAVFLALPGVAFSMREATLPPSPHIQAAYDSIVKAVRFGEGEDLTLMKRFIERFPASSYVPEVTLMMGDRYFLDGLYPLAYTTYSKLTPAMFSGETKRRYLYRYAFSMVKTGYYDEARPLLAALLGDRDYGNAALFYTAYIDYLQGYYDKAYEGFLAVRPTSERGLEAEYYLNQIDFKRGDYRKVTERSRRLLSGDVDYQLRPETMKAAGVSYFKLGDYAKARPLLKEYVETKGDGAETTAVYSLATLYYDEGDYDRAAALFSTLTDDRNDLSQSSWLYLGQINALRGDEQAAAMAFDRAARESWDSGVAETAAFNLSVASASGNRLPFADSSRQMERFISDYPSSPYSATLSRYLVNAYYSQRDYEKALRRLDGMGNDPETAALRQKVNYQYGVDLLRNGDTNGAIQALSKAAAQGAPDSQVAAQASVWLGDAYYREGKYQQAANAYRAAAGSREIGDNASLANYDLGYALMKLKKYKEARAAFDKALNAGGLSASQKADARMRRADCMYYTGDYAAAMTEFRALAREGGQDAVYARIREADILGREGKVGEKISLLQSLADSGDNGIWTSTVLQRLGDAYSENGEDGKAAAVYGRLLDTDKSGKDKSQLYYSLAANAQKLSDAGNVMEALEIYKRLAGSDIPEIYSQGVLGVMRLSDNPMEVAEYAEKAARISGITADVSDEARYMKASSELQLGAADKARGEKTLATMSMNPDSEWGARAALALGQYYLDSGRPAEAETVILRLTDSGCEDSYLLAQGYILLSDAYVAQDKQYLAKLYLETLRANYPGGEKSVYNMIDSRLKKLK